MRGYCRCIERRLKNPSSDKSKPKGLVARCNEWLATDAPLIREQEMARTPELDDWDRHQLFRVEKVLHSYNLVKGLEK